MPIDPETDPPVTAAGRLTPAYAAPEQLRGEPPTPATDVYALGVLAYELLTGTRPHDHAGLPPEEAVRRIETAPPVRPSDTVRLAPEPAASARASTPAALARRLRGDLDAITETALRFAPEDRYPSARALGDDLARHRIGRPVRARPRTRGYVATQFFRRHRTGFALTLGLLLVLGVTAGAYVSNVSRARARAEREAQTAEAVTGVLTSLFDAADPYTEIVGQTDTMRVGAFVALATARIERFPPDDPQVQARLLCTLARVKASLHDLDTADRLFATCFDRARSFEGTPGWVAVAVRDRAVFERERGNYEAAESLATEAIHLHQNLFGPDHIEVAISLSRLGNVQLLRTKLDSAEHNLREALRIYRLREGGRGINTAAGLNDLGGLLHSKGEYESAASLIGQALAIRRSRLGGAHIRTGINLNDLGVVLSDWGKFDSAEVVYREALRVHRAALGADHPESIVPLKNVGVLYSRTGRLEEALRVQEEVFAFRRRSLGDDHPLTISEYGGLGWLNSKLGRNEEAARLLTEGLRRSRRVLGDGHKTTLVLAGNLGFLHNATGNGAFAVPIFRELIPAMVEALGANHAMVAQTRVGLAEALLQTERPSEAEREARAGLASLRLALPEEHANVLAAQSRLGDALVAQRRFEAAESLLQRRLTVVERHVNDDAARRTAVESLVELYDAWGRQNQAARYRAMLGSN